MARTQSRPARQRNAAATRAASPHSARRAFAQAGYDGAGVREIAAGAGLTAMLVNRYFGSKERLFTETVAESMASTSVLEPQITKAEDTQLEGFQIMLRSASSARAARIARKLTESHDQQSIAAALDGGLAVQRAGVMLALIAGFQLMRQVPELPALAKADPAALVKVLGPMFDRLLAATA